MALIFIEGTDATEEFEAAGHSSSARKLMEDYCIGEIDASSIPQLEVAPKKDEKGYAEKLVNLTKQYWGVPVAIVGISVIVGFLYLRKK